METTPLAHEICQEASQLLSKILSDTYLIYLKTQNFHWNLVDARFFSLHKFFQEQYEELAEGIDEIAERIAMLGLKAPGAMSQFLKLTSLQEASGEGTGDEMIHLLLSDHLALGDFLRSQIDRITDLGDHGTADLLIERLRAHEKHSWMLRSHLSFVA